MSREVLHVVPQADQWAVKHEGVERADSTHTTQKEAIDAAREKANDGDSIVIHRADGTIRGRLVYTEDNDTGNGARTDTVGTRTDNRSDRAERREEIKPHDVMSVGTRLSWNAVLAGAVVTVAVYAALMALATAIGVTTRDQFHARPATFVLISIGVAMFCLLVSLFLGGLVVSRITVGEDKTEAIIYGLVLWGTLFTFALVAGSNLGVNLLQGYGSLSNDAASAQAANPFLNDDLAAKLQLTDQQRKTMNEMREPTNPFLSDEVANRLQLSPEQRQTYNDLRHQSQNINPTIVAWVGFAGLILSILAAILGAVEGAGPELVFAQLRDRHPWMRRRVVLAPSGATTPGNGSRLAKV